MAMRVAVCVSGRGSNFEALADALAASSAAQVVVVIADRPAVALERAAARRIPAVQLPVPADGQAWLAILQEHRVELIVLAGYLKHVPDAVIHAYRDRIVNVHPSLLPAFGGAGMYGLRVHRAVLASGATESGATVHLVDEVYDRGAVLAQARVPVHPGEAPETLAARVLEVEHRLLPAVVLAAARAGKPVVVPPVPSDESLTHP